MNGPRRKRHRPRRDYAGVYQRPESSSLWIRFRNSAGRVVRETAGTSDWDVALKRLDLRKGMVASGKWSQEPMVTLRQAREAYYENKLRDARPGEAAPPLRAWRRLRQFLEHPLDFLGLDRTLQSVTRADLYSFVNNRRTPKPRRFGRKVTHSRTPSVAEVNRELSALRALFRWSRGFFELSGTVFDSLTPEDRRLLWQREAPRAYQLSDEELARLLDCSPRYLRDFLTVVVRSGMRHQEAANLDWSEVSLRWRCVTLPAARTKSATDRTIPLDDETLRVLESLPHRTGRVFLGAHNQPVRDFRLAFRRACRRAGLPTGAGGVRLHDLRHKFASTAVEAGMASEVLRRVLGHSDYRMMARYTHPSQGHQLEAMREVGRLLSERLSQSTVRTQPLVLEADSSS
jgi:integrase